MVKVGDKVTSGLIKDTVRVPRDGTCEVEFLADNPLYTKRFAFYVGRRCRKETIQDVARELKLDWDTVKDFSHAVVDHLAKTLPDRFAAKSGADRCQLLGRNLEPVGENGVEHQRDTQREGNLEARWDCLLAEPRHQHQN